MSVSVNFRTDEELKKEAENICRTLGMNMTTAMNMFLTAMVRERTIPFDLTPTSPTPTTADVEWEDYNPMLYDVMRETATRLGGVYLHLADVAKNEQEEDYWVQKDRELFEEINSMPFNTAEKVRSMQDDLNKRLEEALAIGADK
ncbi:MAG: type II toxin-antitoxin system RelB/DinJ family antitoxin [Actinomycetaceae bacterium]|nr:type II toxin-antitoxin system RelB/DinJ family antitoxin [Actinomycetaceae bacterium]